MDENLENKINNNNLGKLGIEAQFDTTREILEGDDYYKIEELESDYDKRRSFLIYIDSDSDKTLTVDDIKKIFNEKFGFHNEALSVNVIGKDNIDGTTVCTKDDIICVMLDVDKNNELASQDSDILRLNGDGNECIDGEYDSYETQEGETNIEHQGESPYKRMIERQTSPIDSDPTKTKKEIAITIDDGYNENGNLEKMLDILDKRGIKATFFTLGEVISWDKNGVWKKEVIGRGHQICCHTFSHAYIGDAEITELFKGHGISPKRRPELVKKWEGYIKNILGMDEYNKIKDLSGPNFPREVNTTALLDAEIRMWEIQIEKSFGKDYLLKMKRDFPFFRFPGKIGANRPENIKVLQDHGYLSIGWTHESGKDKFNQIRGGIELFHVNDNVANNFEKYLDELGIQGTQVTDIVTPE